MAGVQVAASVIANGPTARLKMAIMGFSFALVTGRGQ